MKKLLNIIVLTILFGVLARVEAQTNIVVKFTDGTQRAITIASNGDIYFTGDSIMHINQGNSVVSYNVSSVQRIVFEHQNSITEASLANKTFRFYPNPTKDKITIECGENDGIQQVMIYSTTGMLIKQTQCQNGDKIDVSNLKRGCYIIKINSNVLKMYKL